MNPHTSSWHLCYVLCRSGLFFWHFFTLFIGQAQYILRIRNC